MTGRREPIVTERLVLEPLTLAATTAMLAGDVAELRPAPGWPHADTIDALTAFAAAGARDEDGPWLVRLRETGQVIGDLGPKGGPGPDGTAEIGYGLAVPYRGRGYGTEAVGALAGWLLAREDCSRVIAEVLADNLASRRLLERLGFTLERHDSPYVWYELAER
jgi:RimJ/RimL family protein N-acetyltransferase